MLNNRQNSCFRGLSLTLLLVVLAGCGGDGTTVANGGNNEGTASGLFQGRLVNNGEVSAVTGVTSADGTTVYSLQDNLNAEQVTRALDGQTQGATSPVSFSGQLLRRDGASKSISFDAMLQSGRLTANVTGLGTLQLQRSPSSDKDISSAQLAGNYAFVTRQNTVWQAIIDSDGALTLRSPTGGCVLKGRVNVPNSATNVFRLTAPAGPCEPFHDGLSALGYLDRLPPDTKLLRLEAKSGDDPQRLFFFSRS